MKLALRVILCLGVVTRVWAQDGSYILDSRGVELEQGLQPSLELFENHQAFSQAFKERSQKMALQYSLGNFEYNDPNPEYAWAYEVDAKSSGDMKSAREERRGDVVVGQYTVMDPDGSLRVVDYSVAPGTGFQATVRKESAGEQFQQTQASQYSAVQQGRQNQRDFNQHQRDQYSQHRNEYSQNRNEYSQNRNEYSQNHNQYSQYRNQFSQNRKQYLQNRDQYSQYRDQYSQNRNQYSKNRNEYSLNRDQFSKNSNQYFQNRDQYLQNREQYPQNRNQYSQNRHQYFQTRNQNSLRLNEEATQYSAYEGQNRNQHSQNRNQYLQNRDQYSQNRNQYSLNRNQYSHNRNQFSQNRNQNQNQQNYDQTLSQYNFQNQFSRYSSDAQNRDTNRFSNQYNPRFTRDQSTNSEYSPISVVLASSSSQ